RRSWNLKTRQVGPILRQEMGSDVSRRRAPVEDVDVRIVATTTQVVIRWRAYPRKRRPAGRRSRGSGRSRRTGRTGEGPLDEGLVGMASGARIDQAHHPVARVNARVEHT